MSHVRKQIRDAVVAAVGGVATAIASRVYPLAEPDLPILLVYTNDEEIIGGTMGAYRRALDVIVEIVARGDDHDDAIDALIVGVEQALNQNKLGGLCKPLAPTAISISTDVGSAPIGRARLTYRATYFTEHATPETAV